MAEGDESILRHIRGATVVHAGPFAALPTPVSTLVLDEPLQDRWVEPFYRAGLWTVRSNELFVENFAAACRDMPAEVLRCLLAEYDWRPRIVGAWACAVRRECDLTDALGTLLLRSDVCFAGTGYCLALASLGTPAGIEYLVRYLDYYLDHLELRFDQSFAYNTLRLLEARGVEAHSERFRDRYERFQSGRDDPERQYEIVNAQFHVIDAIRERYLHS